MEGKMEFMKSDEVKKYEFLRQNLIFYLAGILVILGIKLYYRQADCDSLLWILAPTTRWVELLSGISFTYLSGTGYVNHSLRLLIAPSCSGVRFMIITFATLVFSFVHFAASPRKGSGSPRVIRGIGWIAASALLSWVFTVFVNGLRIITAIYLPPYLEDAGLMRGMLTPDRLHTMIGVVVYFAALLTIYRLVGYFVQKDVSAGESLCDTHSGACGRFIPEKLNPVRRCASPAFWYFALTLGLPFLNRANREGRTEFAEFAALVMGCCVLVLLLYCIMLLLRRR